MFILFIIYYLFMIYLIINKYQNYYRYCYYYFSCYFHFFFLVIQIYLHAFIIFQIFSYYWNILSPLSPVLADWLALHSFGVFHKFSRCFAPAIRYFNIFISILILFHISYFDIFVVVSSTVCCCHCHYADYCMPSVSACVCNVCVFVGQPFCYCSFK